MARLFSSFKVAPGLRISTSRRGLRAHVGPRSARIHVGGGSTGVSTGAGPFTLYQSVGSSRRAQQSGRRGQGPVAAAPLSAEEQRRLAHEQAAATLARLEGLHRFAIPTASPKAAPWPALHPFGALLDVAEARELKGVAIWRRAERRAGHARGRELAERWALDLLALAHHNRAVEQARLAAEWEALVQCEPSAVRAALSSAFRSAGAPVAAYDVVGTTVRLTVTGPSEEELPSRKPTFTPTGAPTTAAFNKGERASWLTSLTAARVLLAAKQVFATVPGVTTVEAHVLSPIVEGKTVLACTLRRADLAEASFDPDAWSVLQACAPGLRAKFRGRSGEMAPID